MAVQKTGKKPRVNNPKTHIPGLPLEKRQCVIGAKVEPTLKNMVEKAAELHGETPSTWVRDAIIKKLRRD